MSKHSFDTLPGLRDIDWASYEHAYGSAEDLPDLLESILRGEDDGGDLFANIWHQGTVYSATAVAVPFLAQIIARLHRGEHRETAQTLLHLLALIAYGSGYQQVHHTLSLYDNQDQNELAVTPAREKDEVTAAHLAVCAQWPLLRNLMRDDDLDLRRLSHYVSGRLIGIGAEVFPVLVERWQQETDGGARSLALFAQAQMLMLAQSGSLAYLDAQRFPAPLSAGMVTALNPPLIDRLRQAARTGAPFERWVAADALVAMKEEQPLSPDELAVAWRDSEKMLEDFSDFRDHIWFDSRADVRLAIAAARLHLGAGIRNDALTDIQEIATDRRWRPQAISAVAELLKHADADMRMDAAAWLHHAGHAVAHEAPALLAAGQADPRLPCVLLRPLRAVLPPEEATTRAWLESILAGRDAAALQNNAKLVRAGDPAHWADFAAVWLKRLLDGKALDGNATATDFLYANSSRYGSSWSKTCEQNLIIALIGVLEALDVSLRHIDLIELAARKGNVAAAKLLVTRAPDDPRTRACIETCAADTSRDKWSRRNFLYLQARFSAATRQALIRDVGEDPNPELAEALGAEAEVFVPHWREQLAKKDSSGWGPLRAAKALWTLHGDANEVLPAIVANLSGKPCHRLALELFEDMGDAARRVAPTVQAWRDSTPFFDNSMEDDEAARSRIDALLEIWRR